MVWALYGVGGLVVLVGAAWVAGSLLPAGHVVSRRVRLKQGPEAVWEAISRFAEQPTWRRDLARVERGADVNGHEVWREVSRNGQSLALETVEAAAPARLVRRIAEPGAFGGTWTYEITAAEAGCVLTITEAGEVYNPIFRLMSKMFDMRATMDGYLRQLGEKYGERVELE